MRFEYLLFTIYLLVAIAGQLLQKYGMNHVGAIDGIALLFSKDTFLRIASTPAIWIGIILSGTGFIVWLIVISNFKMSYIYAFSSIAYIIMLFASHFLLGERISWNQWLGTSVIVAGCALLNIKM